MLHSKSGKHIFSGACFPAFCLSEPLCNSGPDLGKFWISLVYCRFKPLFPLIFFSNQLLDVRLNCQPFSPRS